MSRTDRLLATKLHVPPAGDAVVQRPRLLRRLEEGARRGISLVCAPAGFGKSTLVAEWVRGQDAPNAGWVSLDAADGDPVLFWSYLIAALQRAHPEVGVDAGAALRSGSGVRDAVLSVLNDLAALDSPVTLVLDDYHLVDSEEVHEGVALLAERRPSWLHLVLVSRSDPPVPLGRLRGQGRVEDIGAADLRFTLDEASDFLRDVMALEIGPAAIATLEARTEGWVAGLQLAALSMRDRDDQEAFAASLSGEHRHIARFLAEEVVQQQPPEVREFLQQVAILRRMSGPVCDAVTGGTGGGELLEEVARGNLFVIRLDDRQEWYRFHHLFGEFLERRLEQSGADEAGADLDVLHGRASRWFAQEGLMEEAVHHALRTSDTKGAADLIERSWRTLDRRHQSATWRGWVESLPVPIVHARPVLTMGWGWAHLDAGEIDEGERLLDRADALLAGPAEARVVADAREFDALPGTLAAGRAYVAQARGDMDATVKHAERALELLPLDDHFYRGIPAVIVGMAQWSAGRLDEAEVSFLDAVESFTAAGNGLFITMALYALGELQRLRGRVAEATATFRQAERSPDSRGEHRARILRGLAEALLEQGDLEDAARHLEEGRRQAAEGTDHRLCLAMAGLHAARGEGARVEEWLERAGAAFQPELLPEPCSINGWRARWALTEGRLDEVARWLDGAGSEEPREGEAPELVTAWDRRIRVGLQVARVEAGAVPLDAADTAVRDLREASERGGRPGDALDACLLEVRLMAARGDEAAARRLMGEVLDAAEPTGLFRTFLAHGAPLHPWIRDAALRHPERRLPRRLSAAVEATKAPLDSAGPSLPVPLTPREVDILRLVAAGLSNREIAEQCFISVATVKRHAANIFSKLDVSNRTRAAVRADELGLL